MSDGNVVLEKGAGVLHMVHKKTRGIGNENWKLNDAADVTYVCMSVWFSRRQGRRMWHIRLIMYLELREDKYLASVEVFVAVLFGSQVLCTTHVGCDCRWLKLFWKFCHYFWTHLFVFLELTFCALPARFHASSLVLLCQWCLCMYKLFYW